MFLAKCETGEIVASTQAQATQAYYCVTCGAKLSVRVSRRNRPYFAHQQAHCHGGEGETHKAIKQRLQTYYPHLQVEQKRASFRADVIIDEEVIEIQVSAIAQQQIYRRQAHYQHALHWLLGPTFSQQQPQLFIDGYGKVYRYHVDYCLCYDNFHPLTKQKMLSLQRPVHWAYWRTELITPQQLGLPERVFMSGVAFFRQWRATYSTRYAKVNDPAALALYRWGMRSEDLPPYVGVPVPLLSTLTELPVIWQGEVCAQLATGICMNGQREPAMVQFYLTFLVILGVCAQKNDSFFGYRRCTVTQTQLYVAYRQTIVAWQRRV